MQDELPAYLDLVLRALGVVPREGTGPAPVVQPIVRKPMQSVGWKPETPGEEPPY